MRFYSIRPGEAQAHTAHCVGRLSCHLVLVLHLAQQIRLLPRKVIWFLALLLAGGRRRGLCSRSILGNCIATTALLYPHQPHKLGGHLAVLVLGELRLLLPLVRILLRILVAPQEFPLLDLVRVLGHIDGRGIVVAGQLYGGSGSSNSTTTRCISGQ